MVSPKLIRQAIYEKLNVAGLTSLLPQGSASIFHQVAPAEGTYPLVTYSQQSGRTIKLFGYIHNGEDHAIADQLWLVKGVTRDSRSAPAEDIAAAVYELLSFADLAITGGRSLHVEHETDVAYATTEGDTQYRHHGALYRVRLIET